MSSIASVDQLFLSVIPQGVTMSQDAPCKFLQRSSVQQQVEQVDDDYLNRKLNIAKENMNIPWQIDILMELGISCYEKHLLQQSLHYFLESYSLSLQISDKIGIIHSLNNIGLIYKSLHRFVLSLTCYQLCLSQNIVHFNNSDFALELFTLHNNIASIFRLQKCYDTSLEWYLKCKPFFSQIDNTVTIAKFLNNISICYLKLKKFKQAQLYLQKSLQLRESLNDYPSIAQCYHHLGILFYKKNECKKSLEYLLQSLKWYQSVNNTIEIAYCYYSIGQMYLKNQKTHHACHYFKTILDTFDSSQLPISLKIQCYHRLGQYKHVKYFLKMYQLLYTCQQELLLSSSTIHTSRHVQVYQKLFKYSSHLILALHQQHYQNDYLYHSIALQQFYLIMDMQYDSLYEEEEKSIKRISCCYCKPYFLFGIPNTLQSYYSIKIESESVQQLLSNHSHIPIPSSVLEEQLFDKEQMLKEGDFILDIPIYWLPKVIINRKIGIGNWFSKRIKNNSNNNNNNRIVVLDSNAVKCSIEHVEYYQKWNQIQNFSNIYLFHCAEYMYDVLQEDFPKINATILVLDFKIANWNSLIHSYFQLTQCNVNHLILFHSYRVENATEVMKQLYEHGNVEQFTKDNAHCCMELF